ncbi:MAG: hypothetical protein KC584_18110, partial [Nitrospira sp.]|nr:hypothetical protein [Nitrospira sp.]
MRNKLYISTTHKRNASSGSLLGSHRGQWLTAIRCGVAGFMMVSLSLFFGALPVPAASSVPAPEFQLQ